MSKRKEPGSGRGLCVNAGYGIQQFFTSAKSPKLSCNTSAGSPTETDNSSAAPASALSHDDYQETYKRWKTVPFNEIFNAQTVPTDGDCFFTALAHQLHRPLQAARDIRQEIVAFIQTNADRLVHGGSWDNLLSNAGCKVHDLSSYLVLMATDKVWADAIIIRAAAIRYGHRIEMYNSPEDPPVVYSPTFDCDSDAVYGITGHDSPLSLAFVNVNFGLNKISDDGKQDHFVSLVNLTQDQANRARCNEISSECEQPKTSSSSSTTQPTSSASTSQPSSSSPSSQPSSSASTSQPSSSSPSSQPSSSASISQPSSSSPTSQPSSSALTGADLLPGFRAHPHQPQHCDFPTECRKTGDSTGKTRRFQPSWYSDFPWLEWDERKKAAFCHPCRMITLSHINLANSSEETFSAEGYSSNWKKAKERLAKHGKAKSHLEAVCKFQNLVHDTNVVAMVCKQKNDERENATECLKIVFTSLIFLAKQGLAIRRSNEEHGNFQQLLQLRAQDNSTLRAWLCRYKTFTSPQIQNEILEIISREVLLLILKKFHKDQMFSILADETSDISCKEQLSFCLRYVDDNFDCCEEFVGLYQLDSCQAEYIHTAVDDILVRCQISWEDCRGLAFDGAANMAGIRNGVAARIQRHYPKAVFAYCHMHCLNLCVKDTVSDAVPFMRDFFSNILELTSFIRHSPKRMAHLRHINSEQEDSQIHSLRPLCPTRMTVKYNALTAIDSQASSLLQILDDIRSDRTSTHEAQAKASGLLRWLESFEFSFAQTIGLELFGMTDELSKQLQNPKLSAAEGLESVLALKMLLNTKRTDMHFESIWRDVEVRRGRFNGAEAKLPRMRHAPMRFEDGSRAVEFESVDQYFRVQYYLVLDKVTASICERFESSAWKIMHCMETVLVQSCRGEEPLLRDIESILMHASGDLDKDLVGQLSQLRNIPMSTEERNGMTSFSDILKLLKKERALLRLLPQVVKLVKLVCILPCSTATPERSFSQLRRIKNYMRSTVTQERLNHTMIAAVHCDKLENIDINKVMNEFIMRNEHRRATFAKLQ